MGAPAAFAGVASLGTSAGAAADAIAQNSDEIALELNRIGRDILRVLTGILIGKGGGLSDAQDELRRGGAKPATEQVEEERKRKEQEKKRGEGAAGDDPPE